MHLARIWNTETGECVQVLEGHMDEIFSCAFNYEGMHLNLTIFTDRVIFTSSFASPKSIVPIMFIHVHIFTQINHVSQLNFLTQYTSFIYIHVYLYVHVMSHCTQEIRL